MSERAASLKLIKNQTVLTNCAVNLWGFSAQDNTESKSFTAINRHNKIEWEGKNDGST